MPGILDSSNMQRLVTMVEEATRSTEEGVRYFVEPAQGTLRRATNKRHHIVFGRRGSGKTSLLRKAGADLTTGRRPIAHVDLESFKGHSYPDVLLSVLIATFREFRKWMETAAIFRATKKSFWKRFFGRTPTSASYNKKICASLAKNLAEQVVQLERQLHAPDHADTRTTAQLESGSSQSAEAAAGISSRLGGLSAGVSATQETRQARTVQETYRRSKIDFLHRHILDYQGLFQEMATLSNGDSYLFLDDLYHIRRADQPHVVDYFHRIAKGQGLWLKIGTIRHRTNWYVHDDPPIGLKLGDDADDIDLDLTLDKYDLAKDFLKKVLTNFANVAQLPLNDFLTDGAMERLVLASGGVARDFLSIFRRSVDMARERKGGRSGNRIGAEDVNMAAGEHDTSKREEFKKDTSDDDQDLDDQFQRIRRFCLEDANSNCFLLDKEARGKQVDLIHELVDLKLLHLVRPRVTVSGYKGKIYEAYMLDVSQYAGARKRRGLEMVEFWRTGSEERLRRASLIYTPSSPGPS
jgi:hypothetical protein